MRKRDKCAIIITVGTYYISERRGDEPMTQRVHLLLLAIVLIGLVGGISVEAATPTVPPEATPIRESKVIPGEYLVLFRARESVLHLQGAERTGAVAMMLEMQAEHLATKYGVTVENTYSAISETSGKGMFFVRSEKAAKDPDFDQKLVTEMRADQFIEGVSPNEVQKKISSPAKTASKQ